MSKQNRLREAKMYREARNEVLKSEDPEIWIDRDGMAISLGILMDDIHEYIYAVFHMDDNPLRHLRRSFPDFVWKYYEGDDESEAIRIIKNADYIWLRSFGGLKDGIVTATKFDARMPWVLCFRPHGRNREDEVHSCLLRDNIRLKVPEVRFVVNGTKTDANTVFE